MESGYTIDIFVAFGKQTSERDWYDNSRTNRQTRCATSTCHSIHDTEGSCLLGRFTSSPSSYAHSRSHPPNRDATNSNCRSLLNEYGEYGAYELVNYSFVESF